MADNLFIGTADMNQQVLPNLILHRICKSYENKEIFDNLSYEFNLGCYAITGANGIGKSTLLAMMAGAVKPDSGQISINGIDLKLKGKMAKMQLAYIPDKAPIYPFITGLEFIHFIKYAKQVNDTAEIQIALENFKLLPFLNNTFADMSLGTQKKFMIAAALIGSPSVMLFDEPSNALDEDAREFLCRYVQDNISKKVMIFASHDRNFISSVATQELHLLSLPNSNFITAL